MDRFYSHPLEGGPPDSGYPHTGPQGGAAGFDDGFTPGTIGSKPVDRRLSFSEMEAGYGRGYPSMYPSTFNQPVGPRGSYDPMFASVPRYSVPTRQPTMEDYMFSQPTFGETVVDMPPDKRVPTRDAPRRRDSNYAVRHQSPDSDVCHDRERIPVLRPKDYDGTGSWTEFLRRFNMVARANNWSYNTKGDQLKNCLTGSAGSIVHKNPAAVAWTYDDVVDQVGAVYGPSREHQLLLVEKLERRKRKKGESLHTLRDDICELVDIAYPMANREAREALAVERFIRALDNPKIVHRLLQLSPRKIGRASCRERV